MTGRTMRPSDAPRVRGAAPRVPARHAHRRSGALRALVPVLLVLAGVVVLLYPVVATQYNNVKQREFASQYTNDVAKADTSTLDADLKRAEAYNAKLEGVPILDPWLARDSADPKSGPYRAYLNQLATFDTMARVRVPAASIDLPVYHGTSDSVIGKGAGHLYGTSLPVGGVSTHTVLTSHTGMANATLFDHLTQVKTGDQMYVEVEGRTLAYAVDSIKVVLPNQIDDLKKVDGKDLLTLFTCTPYAINTHRLLVTGHRVPYTAPLADAPEQQVGAALKFEDWMYALIAAAFAASVLVLAIVAHERRLQRHISAAHSLPLPIGDRRDVTRPVGRARGGPGVAVLDATELSESVRSTFKAQGPTNDRVGRGLGEQPGGEPEFRRGPAGADEENVTWE